VHVFHARFPLLGFPTRFRRLRVARIALAARLALSREAAFRGRPLPSRFA